MEENSIPSIFEEIAQEGPRFEYASTGHRFANYLVDTITFLLFNYALFFCMALFMAATGSSGEEIRTLFSQKLIVYLITLCLHIVFYTLIEGATKGRTLGKLITGTIAVKQDLSQITFKDAFMRSLCRSIPFDQLSALGGYPWHDSISKTYVINKRKPAY